MQQATIIAGMLLIASNSATAIEPNFNYTWLEAGYHASDFDGEEGNGYHLEGAFSLGSNIFITARAARADADVSITSTWSDTFGTSHEVHYEYELGRKDVALGLGGAWPLGSRLDFTGEVLFIDSELTEALAGGSWTFINPDLPDPRRTVALCELDACESLTLDDEGFAARIGLRGEVSERFELYGNLTYYISDLDPSYTYVQLGKTINIDLDETAFTAGARFAVMEKFFLSLGYLKQGDFTSLQADARIGF